MRRAWILTALFLACSSKETTTPSSAPDAGIDASTDAGVEASAPAGETCIGYGAGETCADVAEKPYGYICVNGAPPGITGCTLKSASSLGDSWCCSENACVEQIDQSAACDGVTGKPHRVQCPPTESGHATPPPDCEEHQSGETDLEKFYCCP